MKTLHLSIGCLKTWYGLEPVPRCEPSTYHLISRWHSHCPLVLVDWAFKNPLWVWSRYRDANPVPTSSLADDIATAPLVLVKTINLPIKPLKPAMCCSRYRDVNPVPTSPLADDIATAPSVPMKTVNLPNGPITTLYGLKPVLRCEPSTYQPLTLATAPSGLGEDHHHRRRHRHHRIRAGQEPCWCWRPLDRGQSLAPVCTNTVLYWRNAGSSPGLHK